ESTPIFGMGGKQCSDYQVGGMIMPGRSGSANSYKYGFGGMEKDDEIKGEGNSLDFSARTYDPRIGRWLSVDPKSAKYPSFAAVVMLHFYLLPSASCSSTPSFAA
ncbi:MAG: hypothetical protein WED10_12335, partial [Brumimicrobium sp.]